MLSLRTSLMLSASLCLALTSFPACTKKPGKDAPKGKTVQRQVAQKGKPVAKARRGRLVIKPTAPPPTARELVALLAPEPAGKAAKAGKADKHGHGKHGHSKPSVSLLRRPTAIGGARYVLVVGSPGAKEKDGSRGLKMEAVVVEKTGAVWALVGRLTLPTDGARVPASLAKDAPGVKDHRRVRAGLRVRDADWDGRAEAVLRYRYPTKGDILERYVLLNVHEGKPTMAFQTIFGRYSGDSGKTKQRARLSYADPDKDGRPELRVITPGDGATMTAIYDYRPDMDRFSVRSGHVSKKQAEEKAKAAAAKAKPTK